MEIVDFILNLPILLASWGLTLNAILPNAFVMLVAGLILWKFFIKELKADMVGAKDCLTDVNHATREVQTIVQKLTTKIRNMDAWQPMHSLPEKLNWATARSPLYLNDMGLKLLKESGMETTVTSNQTSLFESIKLREPNTAYDVQKICYEVLAEMVLSSDAIAKPIKDFAYLHPVFEGIEMNLGSIFFVGSIKLRDLYLDANPTLKATSFDEPKIEAKLN